MNTLIFFFSFFEHFDLHSKIILLCHTAKKTVKVSFSLSLFLSPQLLLLPSQDCWAGGIKVKQKERSRNSLLNWPSGEQFLFYEPGRCWKKTISPLHFTVFPKVFFPFVYPSLHSSVGISDLWLFFILATYSLCCFSEFRGPLHNSLHEQLQRAVGRREQGRREGISHHSQSNCLPHLVLITSQLSHWVGRDGLQKDILR